MGGRAVERRLAAILSADVEGYSRLMGDDEVATVRAITEYRAVIASAVAGHGGRVVDAPGDNVLAEFASVVGAVQCAVDVQRELQSRNAELPPSRQMRFRIGINLGDVIVEGDRLYGDGVNIAARLEGLAEGGGICISGTAYDQIEGKLPFRCESIGEHTVKNIARPVRVYRLHPEPGAPARPASKRRVPGRLVRAVAAAVAVLLLLGAAAWAGRRWLAPESAGLPLPDRPRHGGEPHGGREGPPRPGVDRSARGVRSRASRSRGALPDDTRKQRRGATPVREGARSRSQLRSGLPGTGLDASAELAVSVG